MTTKRQQQKLRYKRRLWRRKKAPREDRGGIAGYVYIAYLGDGVYKIGKSGNPEERLKELMAGNPNIKSISSVRVADMGLCERKLHKRFSGQWVDREWFRLSESDIQSAVEWLNRQSPEGISPKRAPDDKIIVIAPDFSGELME